MYIVVQLPQREVDITKLYEDNSLSDIEKIQRPLEVIHEVTNEDQQLVVDILWSDPTDSDIETGIQPNSTRDPTGVGNIVKFGPDRVEEFLKNNNLNLILRAHECVMDGFERFAGGKLMTVFSATDYCGKHKNAGAIFMGHYSAESYGDYMAGPNHVLPTVSTAKFFSPLGVDDFIKKTSLQKLSKDSALMLADDVDTFAKLEGLTMHALAAAVRKEE